MARQSQIFYKRMAELMAEKRGRKKNSSWHGCDVNFFFFFFSLVKSALLCLRSTRSSRIHRNNLGNTDFEIEVKKIRSDVGLE